jgi:hypothetical protein
MTEIEFNEEDMTRVQGLLNQLKISVRANGVRKLTEENIW